MQETKTLPLNQKFVATNQQRTEWDTKHIRNLVFECAHLRKEYGYACSTFERIIISGLNSQITRFTRLCKAKAKREEGKKAIKDLPPTLKPVGPLLKGEVMAQ